MEIGILVNSANSIDDINYYDVDMDNFDMCVIQQVEIEVDEHLKKYEIIREFNGDIIEIKGLCGGNSEETTIDKLFDRNCNCYYDEFEQQLWNMNIFYGESFEYIFRNQNDEEYLVKGDICLHEVEIIIGDEL